MTGPWWAPAGSDAVGNGIPTATTWLRSTDSVAKEAKSWLEDLEWSVLIYKREKKWLYCLSDSENDGIVIPSSLL